MGRTVLSALVAGVLAGSILGGTPVASAVVDATLDKPAQTIRGQAVAVTLRLPARITAVQGRVVVDRAAAVLIGVAPLGGGQALTPIESADGYAFAAFGLRAVGGHTSVRLVLEPLLDGRPQIRVVIDAAADSSGRRVAASPVAPATQLSVTGSTRVRPAPNVKALPEATRAAMPTRDLKGTGIISGDDLDLGRAAWYEARVAGQYCGSADQAKDANGDGCIDVVDLQALLADQGRQTSVRPASAPPVASRIDTRFTASIGGPLTPVNETSDAGLVFVVNSTADTPDSSPGNGICADSQGRCTLRAALTESNWQPGLDNIHFTLPGTAPVRIQLGSTLPPVGAASGGVVIDGYTQPGSAVNTAQFGTNAVPGVEVRGTGNSMSFGIYVPRAGSTIRGLLVNNSYSGIFVDTSNAVGNRIVGNFIGFNPDNSLPPRGRAGVWLNNGANGTIIGAPGLADRNVIGNVDKGIYSYGAGTTGALIQNNVLCIRPNAQGAICQIGVDHDFGPKGSLIGGTGVNERNVVGPTTINGMEFSHGWDPATGQSTTSWQINDHRIIGNWIGFRPDGHFDPSFRVAQNVPTFDNGQGINIFDGSNNNLAEGNHIGSAHDGVTIGLSNSTGNVVRNNIVGQSPHGESFALNGWGVYLYSNTRNHTVEGNSFYNTSDGGVGLIDFNDQQIRISRNLVFGTNGPAIFLAPNPSNPSTGANSLLPAPVISESSVTQANGTGIAGATVELYKASRAFGQAGLPIAFLGSAVVAGNGTWAITYSTALQTGDRVSVLQIRTNGDTSAMGPNAYAGGPPPAPVADFSWSQAPGTLSLSFTDVSSGSPTSWLWQFGDGTSSTAQNPTHVYGTGGDFSVTLTATNTTGSDPQTHVVPVAPLPPGTTLAADTFTRTSSGTWDSADPGGPYSLEATLGNYSVSSGAGNMLLPNVFANRAALLDQVAARDVDIRFKVRANKVAAGNNYYVYAMVRRVGNNAYRPKLIMFPNGSVAVHSGVLVNNLESSVAPSVVVPGLTYSANSYVWLRAEVAGASPTTIRVKAWADGQPEPASWQFNATNSASAVQGAGSVEIRAFIDNVSNAPVTFSFDDFLVKTPGVPPPPPLPDAGFSFSQVPGTLQVNFTDTTIGAPTSWTWDFGDGTSSTERNPSKTYAGAGEYSVSLTASNAAGPDTAVNTVSVQPLPPAPTADFTYVQQAGTLQVSFTDTSTGAPTAWLWDFGDGTTSTQRNPTKLYAAADDYEVTLVATNIGGSTMVTQTVAVVVPAVTTYAADAFGRTTNNSWGTADIGGAYILEGTSSNFSVSGGVGTIVLPSGGATRAAYLTGPSARDVDILFRVRTNKVAAGGLQYVYGIVRRNGGNAYRPKIILQANGTVQVHCGVVVNNSESSVAPAVTVPGLVYSANSFIWVRAQVTGSSPTTIRVRAWADGQPEPATWHFSATNSQAVVQGPGGVGVRVYMSGGTSNAPVTFGFDDYSVTAFP